MKYRRLDNDGDYTFGHGSQDFINNREAVAQAVKTRLLLLRGEWWENRADGFPLFQEIIGERATEQRRREIDTLVRDCILETINVTKITSLKSDINKRAYTAACVIETKFGQVELEINL